jgi:hypothetical protein
MKFASLLSKSAIYPTDTHTEVIPNGWENILAATAYIILGMQASKIPVDTETNVSRKFDKK